ncbi:unnamed protein product [Brassica oleracea var. botrytis]|uniref:(rape) hypothetical protein n=1 Tax=Brassica napus TaxID=3708 RepID=A0A816RN79_BRANA|nr:unnamed protein product [Brassica napus]
MLGLTTIVGGGGRGRGGALGRGAWWLEDDFSLCMTTHTICLTNDKFIDKKKKTPSLRKSKAKPKEMAKNINSVSITVVRPLGGFHRNPQERGSNILLRVRTGAVPRYKC